MVGRLEGKVAFITGAGGDLAGATASLFAAEGAAVVVQDFDEAAAKARVDEINRAGGRAIAQVCDVTDRAAIDAAFEAAAAELGVIDVLVSAAGISGAADPKDPAAGPVGISDEHWSRLLSIHLDGAFYSTRALVRGLIAAKRGGSIVCISSIAGTAGWGDIHYSTAKGGLLGLVRSVARMCGGLGIRANAVCPGVIKAGMGKDVSDELLEPMRLITPIGHHGDAQDIAAACLYLASDEAKFVTGQALSPNGGLVMP